MGNVIDRIFRGYVVDFIETTFINFPVFNIADVAITIGAVLLIIYILFFDKKEQEKLAAALAEEQPAPEAAEPEIAETEAGETDGEKDADGTSA